MGENHFAAAPTAFYGAILLLCGIAYTILQRLIIASQGPDSILKRAVDRDWKGKVSVALYATAVLAAFRWRWLSIGIYVLVALMWLVPDRRIERAIRTAHE
jgi:uncharacterized membrane protein